MAVEAAGCKHTGIGPKLERGRAKITQEAKPTILTVRTKRKAVHANDKTTQKYLKLQLRALLKASNK